MSSTPVLIKSYPALSKIAPFTIAAFGLGGVNAATGSTDLLIGVTGSLETPATGMADLTLVGIGEVTLGGTVAAGARLTADGQGRGIDAATANGTVQVVGIAVLDGDEGDIIPVLIAPSLFTSA